MVTIMVDEELTGKVIGCAMDVHRERRLIVELKAVSGLLPVHESQLVSYLKSTGIDIGLLINFGATSLQFKRKYRVYNNSTNQESC